jgi:type IX secretion system PorP/SprF family membrane protein
LRCLLIQFYIFTFCCFTVNYYLTMTIKQLTITFLFALTTTLSEAQDPQFSQFYANPLYLNPAFAGGALAPRVTFNYRNQWPGLSANYTTTGFGIDHYFANVNSGVALSVMNDVQGTGNLRSTEISAQYAYQIKINDGLRVRLGLQGTYGNRSANLSTLTFGDQYTNRGFTPGSATNDPIVQNGTPSFGYADFGSGLLVYSDRFWVGVSAHHINRPQMSFFRVLDSDRLPIKGSIHAGYNIPFGGYTGLGDEWSREKTITPAINYRFQGPYRQLDLGVYVTYSPIVLGLWYRGLPVVKSADNKVNQDALTGLIGYRQDRFSFGYSYDLTISSLGPASGGAHEISLSYIFDWEESPKNRRNRKDKQLSCPKF